MRCVSVTSPHRVLGRSGALSRGLYRGIRSYGRAKLKQLGGAGRFRLIEAKCIKQGSPKEKKEVKVSTANVRLCL